MAKKKQDSASGAVTVEPQPAVWSHEKMIINALNVVMQKVSYVQKTGKVKFGSTKYTYASEADILEVARPYFVAAGLILTPDCDEMRESGNKVYVKMNYTLGHVSGAVWPHKLSMWGCGEDKGDKAIYKAITGANKYLWAKFLQLATGDDAEAGKQPEEYNNAPVALPLKKDSAGAVKGYCLRQHGGADDESRNKRLVVLNELLIAVDGSPVRNPDQITKNQWDAMAANLPQ